MEDEAEEKEEEKDEEEDEEEEEEEEEEESIQFRSTCCSQYPLCLVLGHGAAALAPHARVGHEAL